MLLTLPNLLSLSRVPLGLGMAASVIGSHWILAVTLLWIAVATDLLDGYLARKCQQVTQVGGVMDHASDATFVTLVLASWVPHGWVPLALPILVPLSFIQYLLDSRSHRGRSLRASKLGRYNGISYFVMAGLPVMQIVTDLTPIPFDYLIYLGWGLVLTTALSMLDRWISRLQAS